MASERTTQTQTVQQAATNSDGEAPWADLEVAIPSDRNHASLVALVGVCPRRTDSRTGGAVVVAQQVWGTKRTQYVAVDDVGEQFQKRHFDSRLGWHETTVPRETVRDELITKVTRSAVSPPEHTRSSSQRAKHVHREASSGTPDSITDTLNQHSGPVLAQCWLTTFQNSCPQPRPPPCSSTTLPLSAIAIRDRTDTAGCSCLSAPQAVQRATMSAA